MTASIPRDGWVLRRGDADYPAALEDLPDPPARLFGRGAIEALRLPSLSIVGTRRITPYGEALCELAAQIAVESGLAVVSGGALGCDMVAGRKALDAGGVHIVVLGTGADVAYPARNAGLFEEAIRRGGAVVSLEPWGMQPRRYAFPKRNRIIAALSAAVFVAEAGMPSGTFSTAEAAVQVGREVLAAPGSVFSPASRGSNYLIEAGATIVPDAAGLECALSRIYGTLRHEYVPDSSAPPPDTVAQQVLDALAATPLTAEELRCVIGCDARSCLELLSELTVAGRVERLIDGRYAASAAALLERSLHGAQ